MRFLNVLIAVKDIEASKRFYKDVIGLDVEADLGTNVTLTGGISIQTLETWKKFIQKDESDVVFGNNAGELYFESKDIDAFCKLLNERDDIRYVHPLFEHRWGQRVVRFQNASFAIDSNMM